MLQTIAIMKCLGLFLLSCAAATVSRPTVTWQNVIDLHVGHCHYLKNIEILQIAVRKIYLCTLYRDQYLQTHITYLSNENIIRQQLKSLISDIRYIAPSRMSIDVEISVIYPQGLGYNITFAKFETGFSGPSCPYENKMLVLSLSQVSIGRPISLKLKRLSKSGCWD